MSASAGDKGVEEDGVRCCASCGIAGGDDIKLKKCTGCHLVRYCSVKCQKDHRPQHKKECKKRAAELYDEILFKQPECYLGDCPICYLPLPIDKTESTMMSCCSKVICDGCNYANRVREARGKLQCKCPFCREVLPYTDEEWDERLMKRVEVNDPAAICDMGTMRDIEGDYKSAFEYWTKAAALGSVEAHYQLSCLYPKKDTKKELLHLKEAAIGGHPLARHNLGIHSYENGRVDRAVKHFIIAAKLGFDKSLKNLKDLQEAGFVSEEEFASALRGHEAATDATKSPQREEAAEFNLSEDKSGAV